MGLTKLASRLIAKHGLPATLLRPGPGTFNSLGEHIPGPDAEHPALVLVATYAIDLRFVGAGLLDVGDQRVFLSAEGMTAPATTDRLRIGAEVFRLVRITTLAPAGDVIFWELQVRNAA